MKKPRSGRAGTPGQLQRPQGGGSFIRQPDGKLIPAAPADQEQAEQAPAPITGDKSDAAETIPAATPQEQ